MAPNLLLPLSLLVLLVVFCSKIKGRANTPFSREDKADREGIPHTPYSIGNSSRIIFRVGVKLPRALRGCFVEISHD